MFVNHVLPPLHCSHWGLLIDFFKPRIGHGTLRYMSYEWRTLLHSCHVSTTNTPYFHFLHLLSGWSAAASRAWSHSWRTSVASTALPAKSTSCRQMSHICIKDTRQEGVNVCVCLCVCVCVCVCVCKGVVIQQGCCTCVPDGHVHLKRYLFSLFHPDLCS